MTNMKVYILTCDVDLGVSIEGVYASKDAAQVLCDFNNKRDKISWQGYDGHTYWSTDKWRVEVHTVGE